MDLQMYVQIERQIHTIEKYDRCNDGDHVYDNGEDDDDNDVDDNDDSDDDVHDSDDDFTSKTQWSSDLYNCLESVCIRI